MQKAEAAEGAAALKEILTISRELHSFAISHDKKLDKVHEEVSRTGLVVAAVRDNIKAVEAAVRHQPRWLLVFFVGALLGASLLLHALRLLS